MFSSQSNFVLFSFSDLSSLHYSGFHSKLDQVSKEIPPPIQNNSKDLFLHQFPTPKNTKKTNNDSKESSVPRCLVVPRRASSRLVARAGTAQRASLASLRGRRSHQAKGAATRAESTNVAGEEQQGEAGGWWLWLVAPRFVWISMDFRNWQLHGDFWWDFTQKSWGNPDILWKSPWKSQAVQEVIDLEDFDAWEAVLTNFGAFHGGTPAGWLISGKIHL